MLKRILFLWLFLMCSVAITGAFVTLGGRLTPQPLVATDDGQAPPAFPAAVERPDAGQGAGGRPGLALPPAGTLPDLTAVAEAALKVSANISSTTTQRVNPFDQLFYGAGPTAQSQSLGSGVVVSPNGYVLTNTHVIGDERADIRVTLQDGKERMGKLVGIDDVSDLAVVKIDATGLQTLPWGDSTKLRVAEWVLAVGNPFQLSGTVTLGIVSTVSRTGSATAYSDFIQTDAAINPGNSGGALVNARGELIGINTMIISESGGNQGIGFAIPAHRARRIMDELIANGSVVWGSIGQVQWVTMSTINPQAARRYQFASSTGVLAAGIANGAQASRAGLEAGDIVLEYNGQLVKDADQLDRLIKDTKVGTTAKLTVVRYRTGRQATVDVPVTSRTQR